VRLEREDRTRGFELLVTEVFPEFEDAAGAHAYTVGELLSGQITGLNENSAPSIKNSASGVVPDTVAAVALRLRNGQEISTPVANNYWAIAVPKHEQAHAVTVAWRSASGQIIRSYQLLGSH
jgi:hypothetical protein